MRTGHHGDRSASDERRADRLARLERWTEWPLTILAILLVPILLAPALFDLASDTETAINALDYLIWGVFAADLVAKVAVAPARRHYLRTHLLDVALVALPFLRPLRLARSARALRLLRLTRATVALGRFTVGARRILVRHGLHYALAVALFVVILAGSLVAILEHDSPDATIQGLPDGLWWAVTTVTTVGYSDTYPKTPAGRGVGVVLMLLGISLFSVITANVAAFFVEEREDELLAEVRALRRELQEESSATTLLDSGQDSEHLHT